MTAALSACGAFDGEFIDDEVFEEEAGQSETQSEVLAGAPSFDAEFNEQECLFDSPPGTVVDCGILDVPENRLDPNTAAIQLDVAILRAQSGTSRADPVVYLAGGPGSSSLDEFYSDPESWLIYAFTNDRDLIFIDQRGTGYSQPSLDCPEVDSEEFDTSSDPEVAAAQACRDRLAGEGIDLTAYNSAQSAADIEDLRMALGYEQWNLYGISYGTRLALTVMRDHPQGIRSVTLDSTYPPNVDAPVEEGIHLIEALGVLLDGCSDDPDCDAAYPDLDDVFVNTVMRLNDLPEVAVLIDPETDEEYEQEISGDDLANAVLSGLNDAQIIPLLPRVIFEVSQGNFETFSLLEGSGGAGMWRQDEQDVSDSEGMNFSVQCREEYALSSYAAAEAQALTEIPDALMAVVFGPTMVYFEVCEFWGAGQAEIIENTAVSSDIPTLILAGQYDPVTPPAWGQIAARTLSNSFFFEFPGLGHAVTGGGDCPVSIMDEFIANPEFQPEASCIDDLSEPLFYLPDEPVNF